MLHLIHLRLTGRLAPRVPPHRWAVSGTVVHRPPRVRRSTLLDSGVMQEPVDPQALSGVLRRTVLQLRRTATRLRWLVTYRAGTRDPDEDALHVLQSHLESAATEVEDAVDQFETDTGTLAPVAVSTMPRA